MQNDIGQKFNRLAKIWHEECDHFSFMGVTTEHYAYQHIINMGPAVVPYILEELERRPDHWFFALRAITGEDPVRQQNLGRVREMARDWLEWGRKRDLLRPEQSISHAEALQMQFNQIVIAQAVHLLAFHVEQLRRSHDPEAVVEIGTVRKEMATIIRGTSKEEGREGEGKISTEGRSVMPDNYGRMTSSEAPEALKEFCFPGGLEIKEEKQSGQKDCGSGKEKYLVEALGGCWHKRNWDVGETGLICSKCGSVEVIPNFSKWEGFGWLWERAKKKEWWKKFVADHSFMYYSVWHFIPLIDPLRFSQELYKFLKEREK